MPPKASWWAALRQRGHPREGSSLGRSVAGGGLPSESCACPPRGAGGRRPRANRNTVRKFSRRVEGLVRYNIGARRIQQLGARVLRLKEDLR